MGRARGRSGSPPPNPDVCCPPHLCRRRGPGRPVPPTRGGQTDARLRSSKQLLMRALHGEQPERLPGRAALVQLDLDLHRQGLGLVVAFVHWVKDEHVSPHR